MRTALRRINRLIGAPPTERRLFLQALLLSGIVRCALAALAFERILRWKGTPGSESATEPDPPSEDYRLRLTESIARVARHAPWPTGCYTLAITARLLLSRKGLGSTIYVGFRKGETGRYLGHAWLRSHDTIVTGGESALNYTVHSTYA